MAINEIEKVFLDRYNLQNNNLKTSLENLKQYFNCLKPDLYVMIEHPYVDKIYRDTYYNYFASKKDHYPRNTIRLSFLNANIAESSFRSEDGVEEINECYLGFLVLRPTFPLVAGRCLINPTAFKDSDFKTCLVDYNATINSIKVKIKGFPHSSQDQETISCAETTVWSIMEYFGTKYPEYRPSLPSEVNKVLGKFAFERLIPSKGLTAAQISYALKELGFGVKIYSADVYESEYYRLLSIYVESGIPVVGLLTNDKGIGHALNIIGRKKIDKNMVQSIEGGQILNNGTQLFDFADLKMDYIFVDDNHPPYQAAPLSEPAKYYKNERWSGCKVNHFIVPLYPKIYLEAGEARRVSISILNQLSSGKNKEVLIKTFLCSSRSFKNSIALNKTLDQDAKELLLGVPMPKFVWITELSNKELILEDKADGMLILDATEPKRPGIIAALIDGAYISNDLTTFTKVKLPLRPFSNYQNNLK